MTDTVGKMEPRLVARRYRLLAALIALALACQSFLVIRLNVNWDEFWFLGRIHLSEDGVLSEPFQNFHVWFLGWIARLPFDAVEQVVVGRVVMLVLEGIALFCLYVIARRFVSRNASLLLVALWFASLYSLPHGASFRTDPLSAALMMASLAIVFSSTRILAFALAGLLAAMSLLVTVKAALYLPAFIAALVLSWGRDGRGTALLRFGVAGLALAVAGWTLWSWQVGHMTTPSPVEPAPLDRAVELNSSAAQRMLADPDRGDQLVYIVYWAFGSLATFGVLCGAFILCAKDLARTNGRWLAVACLLCMLPMVTPFFFRNAFPYFYPYILYPAMLGAMPMARWLVDQRQPWLEAILVIALAGVIGQFASYLPRDQQAQRAYVEAIDEAFPEPVAYIERGTMLPSFRKSGFFMSTLGIENSVRPGGPRLESAIRADHPPLLILSVPALRAAVGRDPGGEGPRLHPDDEAVLRSNYIEHWGDIWVAGQHLARSAGSIEIVIPGEYTLECDGDRAIGGRRVACGDVVFLDEGSADYRGGAMTLRWGAHLSRPLEAPPDALIYHQL